MKKLMKKTIICALLVFMMIILASCHSKQAQPQVQIIDSSNLVESGNLFESAKSWDYIHLETSGSVVLGEIQDVRCDMEKIFIADGHPGDVQKICVFDKTGQYLCSIGQRGRGHGEYISIRMWTLDLKNHEVVLCDAGKRIKKYDYSGRFVCEIKTDADFTYAESFLVLNDGRYLVKNALNEAKSDEYLLCDKSFNIVDRIPHRNMTIHGLQSFMSSDMGHSKDSVYLMCDLCDIVYGIVDNRIVPVFTLNDTPQLPVDFHFGGEGVGEIMDIQRKLGFPMINGFFVMDDYLLFRSIKSDILWNKKNKRGIKFMSERDMSKIEVVWPDKLVGTNGNTLIGVKTARQVQAEQSISNEEGGYISRKAKGLFDYCSSLDADCQILLMYEYD